MADRGNAFYYKTLKNRFTSKQYLFTVLAYTLALLLNLAFLPNAMLSRIIDSYDDLLYNVGLSQESFWLSYSDLTNFAGIFGYAITVITIITVLISIVFAVGFWICYISFLSKRAKPRTLGFKLIKTTAAVALPVYTVVFAALSVLLLSLFLNPDEKAYISLGEFSLVVGRGVHDIMGISSAICAVFAVAAALYFAMIIKSASALAKSAENWESARISRFIPFIHLFVSILSLAPMAGCVYMSSNMDGGFMVPFFANLMTAAYCLSFNVFIARFNGAMKNTERNIEKAKRKNIEKARENARAKQSGNKEKFVVNIDESGSGKARREKCRKCGKFYDGAESSECPYCSGADGKSVNAKKK